MAQGPSYARGGACPRGAGDLARHARASKVEPSASPTHRGGRLRERNFRRRPRQGEPRADGNHEGAPMVQRAGFLNLFLGCRFRTPRSPCLRKVPCREASSSARLRSSSPQCLADLWLPSKRCPAGRGGRRRPRHHCDASRPVAGEALVRSIGREKYEEAVDVAAAKVYEEVIERLPEGAQVEPWKRWTGSGEALRLYALGRDAQARRRLDEAVALLRRSVAADPVNAVGCFALGNALSKNGHLFQALLVYLPQVTSTWPGLLEAQYPRAATYSMVEAWKEEALGSSDGWATRCEHGLQLSPRPDN